MMDWWPAIGETSATAGSALGLVWALISTARRRRKYIRAAIPPTGQLRWFLVSFLSMGTYGALVTALGLASLHGYLPQQLFWYLLGLSLLAHATTLLFPAAALPRHLDAGREPRDPPADPPRLPVRKTA